MLSKKHLLALTALVEAATGLALLIVPGIVFGVLLGVARPSPEALLVGMVAGAALVAIGVSCWPGRADPWSLSQQGLLYGVLYYDVAASILLAYAGSALHMAGVLLWPAVVLHAALAVWCLGIVWKRPGGQAV